MIAEPGKGGKVVLMSYEAGKASAGSARVRGAHGAAELPKADFKVGDETLGTPEPAARTGDYATVEPGSYAVMATRPGSDDAVISQDGVNFAAGTASTAYAVGSGGERARFVVVQDGVDAPEGGPATGLGGLSGDDDRPGSRLCWPRWPRARSAAWRTRASRAVTAAPDAACKPRRRLTGPGWPPRSSSRRWPRAGAVLVLGGEDDEPRPPPTARAAGLARKAERPAHARARAPHARCARSSPGAGAPACRRSRSRASRAESARRRRSGSRSPTPGSETVIDPVGTRKGEIEVPAARAARAGSRAARARASRAGRW